MFLLLNRLLIPLYYLLSSLRVYPLAYRLFALHLNRPLFQRFDRVFNLLHALLPYHRNNRPVIPLRFLAHNLLIYRLLNPRPVHPINLSHPLQKTHLRSPPLLPRLFHPLFLLFNLLVNLRSSLLAVLVQILILVDQLEHLSHCLSFGTSSMTIP
jgi:hypothetical protein